MLCRPFRAPRVFAALPRALPWAGLGQAFGLGVGAPSRGRCFGLACGRPLAWGLALLHQGRCPGVACGTPLAWGLALLHQGRCPGQWSGGETDSLKFRAPKGRPKPAQGSALGHGGLRWSSPERAAQVTGEAPGCWAALSGLPASSRLLGLACGRPLALGAGWVALAALREWCFSHTKARSRHSPGGFA